MLYQSIQKTLMFLLCIQVVESDKCSILSLRSILKCACVLMTPSEGGFRVCSSTSWGPRATGGFQLIQTDANPFYDMLKSSKQITIWLSKRIGFGGGDSCPQSSKRCVWSQRCVQSVFQQPVVFSLAKPSGDTDWSPGVQLGGAFEAPSWLLDQVSSVCFSWEETDWGPNRFSACVPLDGGMRVDFPARLG